MASGEQLLLDEETQLDLAIMLVDEDLFGVREDPADYIELKSKRLSPHYLDVRQGLSSYESRTRIATAMGDLAKAHWQAEGLAVEYVVGAPEAMTSFAASTADQLKMGLLQPRVATNKVSGNKTPILGRHTPGQRISGFDDVITDGTTKIDTIASWRAAGLEVVSYYAVLDREEGGAPQVAEATGITITPALRISKIVKMLRAEGKFSAKQFDNVKQYLSTYGEASAREEINTI